MNSLAFESISGNKMADEMEKKRSSVITQKSADSSASFMYEYLNQDSMQNAVLFIVRDPHFLFEKQVLEEISKLQRSQPEYAFMAFKKNRQEISPLTATIPEQRHLLRHSRQIAEVTSKRSSASREHYPDLTQVAMPIGPSSSLIVTGAASHDDIIQTENIRLAVFGLIFIFSLAVTFLSAFFTATNLLQPLTELKFALEKTIEGDLSVNLVSNRPDELGKLTEAFSGMLSGLREKEKNLLPCFLIMQLKQLQILIPVESQQCQRRLNSMGLLWSQTSEILPLYAAAMTVKPSFHCSTSISQE